MTSIAVLENKISALKKYLGILENYDIVYDVLQNGAGDIQEFLESISHVF